MDERLTPLAFFFASGHCHWNNFNSTNQPDTAHGHTTRHNDTTLHTVQCAHVTRHDTTRHDTTQLWTSASRLLLLSLLAAAAAAVAVAAHAERARVAVVGQGAGVVVLRVGHDTEVAAPARADHWTAARLVVGLHGDVRALGQRLLLCDALRRLDRRLVPG